MSDFIYASTLQPAGVLEKNLKNIYDDNSIETKEYHGSWGSIAITKNLFDGYEEFNGNTLLIITIGAPIVKFKSDGLKKKHKAWVNEAIGERSFSTTISWDTELDGPFVTIIINKQSNSVRIITDLMLFIPVYKFETDNSVLLSSHIDALAVASSQTDIYDSVSLADFALNGVVTYPYTIYNNISQCHPATEYTITVEDTNPLIKIGTPYWMPKQNNTFKNIDDAAVSLRVALKSYVDAATEGARKVAQFLSAGEDSRAICGLLPENISCDAFVFLDSMNREGKIAKKIASAYNVNFIMEARVKTMYLDILPGATDLIGSGHQYTHAHTFAFYKKCNLRDYDAVFGGYLADSLVKGAYAATWPNWRLLPFLPKKYVSKPKNEIPLRSRHKILLDDIGNQIHQRQKEHLQRIYQFRTDSAYEWFELWPMTMRKAISNLYSNRRLFRTYEPFMSNDVVKICADVPTEWKLNRKLFHLATQPLFKKSKWVPHSDGRLPYFSWKVNTLLQIPYWVELNVKRLLKRTHLYTGNPGSWSDWHTVRKTDEYKNLCATVLDNTQNFTNAFLKAPLPSHGFSQLTTTQQLNILQLCYVYKKNIAANFATETS